MSCFCARKKNIQRAELFKLRKSGRPGAGKSSAAGNSGDGGGSTARDERPLRRDLSEDGLRSIPPERLLRALLLQMVSSIRSELPGKSNTARFCASSSRFEILPRPLAFIPINRS
jgi:hypothetical protein